MKIVAFLTAMSVALFPVLSYAQDEKKEQVEIDLFYIGPGVMVTLPDGSVGRAYNLPEWLNLVRVDNALHSTQSQLRLINDIELSFTNIISQKDDIITTLQSDKDTLATRSLRIEGNWLKCEEELVNEAGGPVWPYILAGIGGAIGVAGGIALAVGITLVNSR